MEQAIVLPSTNKVRLAGYNLILEENSAELSSFPNFVSTTFPKNALKMNKTCVVKKGCLDFHIEQ